MFGLYAVLSERTLNGNGLAKRRGGVHSVVPLPIFWRFPVAPACLHPSCVLPASVLRPASLSCLPACLSHLLPLPFPFPIKEQQRMNAAKHSFLCALLSSCVRSCPQSKQMCLWRHKEREGSPCPQFSMAKYFAGNWKKNRPTYCISIKLDYIYTIERQEKHRKIT